ncbi:YggS family pyridoxal phosphate-dependent enzyme [Lentimicrobium sp. S6]|uniref:YggS family pyridoxal phosphate-dependent enzyme n=1 Tax=Lentimicrobium sp. S6 TaxID=2735872 RepID=UPI00155485D7|nr:YggS family pyridoxal phosphate-dependent enzyme [Lentimicrobium sp. S6]NPD46245.1 YggS family pyridoxal phosphate-dependent enzyme [Lentimicrobium sp. S6]
MGTIAKNMRHFIDLIPNHVKIVAVSKTKPNEDILEAYNQGQRIFGENKAQDLAAKAEVLPSDIQWHFIGHLQTNKVKYIAPFVTLLHAVDSFKLLAEINKQAKKNDRIISCLLQFHIASEETKFGLDMTEAIAILEDVRFKDLKNIEIIGVMGMATYIDDELVIRKEFGHLASNFKELKASFFKEQDSFREISMGMSGDYQLAIEEGSTMVRVGSSIFGARNY